MAPRTLSNERFSNMSRITWSMPEGAGSWIKCRTWRIQFDLESTFEMRGSHDGIDHNSCGRAWDQLNELPRGRTWLEGCAQRSLHMAV